MLEFIPNLLRDRTGETCEASGEIGSRPGVYPELASGPGGRDLRGIWGDRLVYWSLSRTRFGTGRGETCEASGEIGSCTGVYPELASGPDGRDFNASFSEL